MEYITKKDLIDCSTPDEFCFSLCCMECKTVWKSTPIRFSRAGKKPENENRKIIYDTLYEREKNLAFQKALNQAKEIHLCEYEDTESYQVTEMFINNRQMLLDRLLTD